MTDPAATPTLFADAIEIPQWLERDRDTPYPVRLHRDRKIADSITAADPAARVRAWWRQLRPDAATAHPDAPSALQLEHARRLIALLMVIAGIVVGAAAASTVFRYDGTWPVNVVTVLATLVLVQLFLIALSLLLMLPRVPGLAAIQSLLAGINPGAIVAAIYRRARHPGDGSGSLLNWHAARGPTAARFTRWQILAWSQLAAVAFNLAVLATASALIAFTDLAFGWSTTLQMSSSEALRITDAISAPWRNLWPEAVPGAALIDESRFFRLASAQPAAAPAAALTGWWPFLLAAIFTYALLPRCLLLLLAQSRLRIATVRLLLDDPQVKALLDRMKSAEIALGAAEAESTQMQASASRSALAPSSRPPAAAIVWSGAVPADAAQQWAAAHLQWRVTRVHEAGGGRSLSADESVVAQLASAKPAAVLVFVRAWEAPLLDLHDFIVMMRTRLDPKCSLIVVPVGTDGEPATAEQRATWSRWTARIADPGLYLESGV